MPSAATRLLLKTTANRGLSRVEYTLRGNEVFILPETGWSTDASSGEPDYISLQPWNDASFRFKATFQKLELKCYLKAGVVLVTIDGVDYPVVTHPNSSAFGWQPLVTGISGAVEREVIVSSVRPNTSSFPFWIRFAVSGSINRAALSARTNYAFYGDSVVFGSTVAATNSSTCFPHLIGLNRNVIVSNRGLAGSSVSGGAASSGAVRTADITGLSPAPTRCVVYYGTNDTDAIVATTLTLAQFESDYTAMLNALVAGLPSCKFYCLGLLPRTDKTLGQISPVSARIEAAVTAVANANVTYHDAYSWITSPTDLADAKHPNASGNAKIATQLLSIVAS